MGLVVFTDFTVTTLGLFGQKTALSGTFVKCDGCEIRLSSTREPTEFDQGFVIAEAGQLALWRTERDGVSRVYCDACRRKDPDGGKWGWTRDHRVWGLDHHGTPIRR